MLTRFLTFHLALLYLLVGSPETEAAETDSPATARPNILFLYTDDQADWTVGVTGNPQTRTPHLDRLMHGGARFSNAFTTTPVCSPSRAGLMTSRYGSEWNITDWIRPDSEPELGLDPQATTWPQLMATAGYHTGLIGKWHLGTAPRYHPSHFGFAHFTGFLAGGCAVKDPLLEVAGQAKAMSGLTTDILTDAAIDFLEHRPADRPFLLCVHYRAPHAPWLPVSQDDWTPFADRDLEIPNPDYPDLDVPRVRKSMREYLASIHGVDRNVGRLLACLDQLGLVQDTLVVFTSDHGYNMGHNGIWHKGNGHWIVKHPPQGTDNVPTGQRPNLYDNSIRVPACVRWPAAVPPDTVIDRTVTNLDWFPTLLEAAGVAVPEGCAIRGRSMLALLRGETPEWDNDLFVQYSTHHQSRTHMRAYRTPQWKLVRDFLNPGRDELYHLAQDAAETKNLIDSSDASVAQVIEALDARLREKMAEIGDHCGRP
jgi:uncharacterized sulfatase